VGRPFFLVAGFSLWEAGIVDLRPKGGKRRGRNGGSTPARRGAAVNLGSGNRSIASKDISRRGLAGADTHH
jgi:hypothetical protein